MKKALVEFIVQVPDEDLPYSEALIAAMNQAERYLNTGSKYVDFNVRFLTPEEEMTGHASVPVPCRGRALPLPSDHLDESDD